MKMMMMMQRSNHDNNDGVIAGDDDDIMYCNINLEPPQPPPPSHIYPLPVNQSVPTPPGRKALKSGEPINLDIPPDPPNTVMESSLGCF